MSVLRLLLGLTFLVPAMGACTSSEAPAAAPWPGDDERPALEHPFFEGQPGLKDLSLYAVHVRGSKMRRPDYAHRGTFGIGNGRMFALMGLADPINTLHSTIGPVYYKGPRFFGDMSIRLVQGEEISDFSEEWAARVRDTAVMVTRADTADTSMYTIDFAPRKTGAEVSPMIVRFIATQVHSGDKRQVRLRLDAAQRRTRIDGHLTEVNEGRFLTYLPVGAEIISDNRGNHIDLGMMGPGDTQVTALVLATTTSTGAEVEQFVQALSQTGPEVLLAETLEYWKAFSHSGLTLEVDGDPRIEDLFDGMRISTKTQQTVSGAVCPMSQYTLMWLRDFIGTTKFTLRAGRSEDTLAALNYLYACHVERGNIGNSCDSGLLVLPADENFDWDNAPQHGGRTRAESPTYIPLAYREYVHYTQDWELIERRWSYLKHALLGQQMDEQGRQPFSGDETFRAAMSAAFGYDLAYLYEDYTWSANSAFLMLSATRWMVQAANHLGKTEDVAVFEALNAKVSSALTEHFLQPEGQFAPFIFVEGEVPETRPFEDVNLKAIWAGAYAPDDPIALKNLEVLERYAGREGAKLQSPLDAKYVDFLSPVKEGINTGMMPGYYLYNLSATGDPKAEQAFNNLHIYADDAGQYREYMIFDDHSGYTLVYDESGVIGDYSAHYRPWEGGINIDAFLQYLWGLDRNEEGALTLRPHLPNHQPSMKAVGLRMGAQVLDATLTQDGEHIELEVRVLQGAPELTLQLDFPLPAGRSLKRAEMNGEETGTVITLPRGELAVRFAKVTIAAGARQVFRMTLGD